MSRQPRIERRVTPEQKEAWQSFCLEKGVSESEMLGLLIDKATEGKVSFGLKGLAEPKTGKVTIRFHPKDLMSLTDRAKAEGYASRTKWLSSLALAALHREPVLTDPEIMVLRESNRELAAIGRNLNQITKALNTDFRESDRVTREAIERLSGFIERHKDKVISLLNRNLNRWGQDE